MSNTIQIIFGIIPIILAIIQMFTVNNSKGRYFKYPYFECPDPWFERLITRSQLLWKTTSLFVLASFFSLIIYVALFHVQSNIVDISIINLTMIGAAAIKEIFRNVIVWKPKFRIFYCTHIKDMIENIVTFILLALLLLCAIVVFFQSYKNTPLELSLTPIIITAIIFFEVVFCISRIIADTTELYYSYGVKSLSIKTIDGTEYTNIMAFKDNRSSIKICNQKNKVVFLEKRNIIAIEKQLEQLPVVDVVIESLKNKRAKS